MNPRTKYEVVEQPVEIIGIAEESIGRNRPVLGRFRPKSLTGNAVLAKKPAKFLNDGFAVKKFPFRRKIAVKKITTKLF